MEDGEAQRGNGDHDTIEDDEVDFVLHDRVGPSVGHFCDTENATSEDDEERKHDGRGEELEIARSEEVDRFLSEAIAAFVGRVGVVGNQSAEDE